MKTIIIDGVEYDLTPKALFKKGDWIYHEISSNTFRINKIENGLYVSDEGATISLGRQNDWRLWTIQDAKDGDVLVVNNEIFIYAHRKQMYSIAVAQCFVDSAGGFYLDGEFGYTEKGNSIHPATKEQRDQLMKAMAEAGYEWDVEKKELKKIEQTYFQKQEWTGYDEKAYEIALLDIDKSPSITKNDTIDWLKSLKNRAQLQSKQEWSEEDDYILNLVSKFTSKGYKSHPKIPSLEFVQDWLKSLKERNTWKPSDRQMKQLGWVAEQNKDNALGKELMTLYQDLKKLREE